MRGWTANPVRVFLWSRLALWAIAAVTVLAFSRHLNPERYRWDDPLLHDLGSAIDVWARWDSFFYLRIAEDGYAWPSSRPAFFPLYPLLVRGLGTILGGHYVLAGVVVSLAAAAVAFRLLHGLAASLAGTQVASRAVLFLALFPTTLFLGAVYSEALFLALALGVFLLARNGRHGPAGFVAGLAVLTRAQGVALVPVVALLAWRDGGPRAAVRAVVPAALLSLVYPLVLWLTIDRPFAFVEGQDVWQRRLSPLGPLGGPVEAIRDADLVELGFAVFMVALAVVAWRRLGTAYGLYATLVLAIPMSLPSERLGGLYSFPRLALAAFPCFIALATVTARRPVAAAAFAAVSGALLAYYVVRWSLWYWVA